MADTSGQYDIRGLDIQKLAVAYNEEARIFRNFVRGAKTSAREIRWYRKNAGILTPTSTSAGTNFGANVAELALPNVIEQADTRYTSYVKKYFLSTPVISNEDIMDTDIDIYAQNLRDTVIALEYQVDTRIWDVITESRSPTASGILSGSTVAAWDAGSGQNPVKDIVTGLRVIRENSYEKVINPILFLNPKDYASLLSWLIGTLGSSVPSFASGRIADGVLTNILGCDVVVSMNVTADYALLCDPNGAVWKELTPVTTGIVEHVGIGKEIRVWCEGECILEKSKLFYLLINTAT